MTETDTGPTRRWLTPGVKGIGGASLLADIGHEIPTALLPSLLTATLGAPASALGIIERPPINSGKDHFAQPDPTPILIPRGGRSP